MRAARGALLLAVTLACSACGPNAGTPAQAPASAASATPAPPPPSVTPVSSSLPGSNEAPDSQPAVATALGDAASHLGVIPSDLHVGQVEAHQWPDSSLGCPKPGLMYSQIVTPGYLIVISAAGKELEYHSDARARVVLCQER